MSSERRVTKSLTPLIIIGEGRFALFTGEMCAPGLLTSGYGFGVIVSTSIASVCDRTSNRFLEINSFLCLLIFWVGELGSEELERFLFSACCMQPSLLGLFVLFCVD